MHTLRLAALLVSFFCFTLPVAQAEPATKPSTDNFTFVVIGDPQFGLYANNKNMDYEIPHVIKAVETINRIKPAFVVVDGDLANAMTETPDGTRQAQVAKFKELFSKIDKSIPLYLVSGNHDMTNSPKPLDIDWYKKTYGDDHYTFQFGNSLFIVLNSSLIAHPDKVSAEEAAQKAWLVQQLEAAQKSGITSITIFQHHPWFLKTAEEKDAYDNLPLQVRNDYLALFRKYHVQTVICGHLHYPLTAEDAGVKIVVVGALGKSFRGEPGFVLGHYNSGTEQFTYIDLSKFDELPVLAAPSANH